MREREREREIGRKREIGRRERGRKREIGRKRERGRKREGKKERGKERGGDKKREREQEIIFSSRQLFSAANKSRLHSISTCKWLISFSFKKSSWTLLLLLFVLV